MSIPPDLGTRTLRAACPFCGHDGLEYRLRCELSYGDCLHVAHCPSCAMDYGIDVDREPGPGEARAELCCDSVTRTCRLVPLPGSRPTEG